MTTRADFLSPGVQPPPDGVVVETVSASGTVQRLKQRGRLWFVPDGSMYVYYEVVGWRPLPGQVVPL